MKRKETHINPTRIKNNIGMKIQKIFKYLQKHEIYADIYEDNNQICILVAWGDWKHDHAYLNYLMNNIGYNCINEELLESDGSDCYSAVHHFEKVKNVHFH